MLSSCSSEIPFVDHSFRVLPSVVTASHMGLFHCEFELIKTIKFKIHSLLAPAEYSIALSTVAGPFHDCRKLH